jgi:tetratricopeptide (TPR) repeat protein
MTTKTDERIATLIGLITGKEEQAALIELLEAIRASQEAQKLLDRRAYAQALAQTQKAVSTQWPSWQVWYQHGRVLYKSKKYKDAIHAYRKSIALNPERAWEKCWDNLKDSYDRTSDYIEGWHYYSRLVEERPYTDWWQAWHGRGFMGYRMVKRFPEEIVKSFLDPAEVHESIIKSFIRSIELHHDNQGWIWSSENLKAHLIAQKEMDRGLQIFTDLCQRYPNYWILWHDRALFEVKAKQHEKATKSFLEAIAKQPDGGWFWSWKHLGETYLTQQNFTEAANALQMAIEQAPKLNYGLGESANMWRAWRGRANALKELEIRPCAS